MKKLLVTLALATSLASAKDMTGKFALGGGAALNGPPALTFALQFNTFMMMDAYVAWLQADPAFWDLGGHLFLNLADFDNSNLYLGGGINLGFDTREGAGGPAPDYEGVDLSLEGVIRPTWYFNDHLALYILTGVVIDLSQRRLETTDNEITIELGSQLLGSGGINFFF